MGQPLGALDPSMACLRQARPMILAWPERVVGLIAAVASCKSDPHDFKASGSNPRIIGHLNLKMPL